VKRVMSTSSYFHSPEVVKQFMGEFRIRELQLMFVFT